MSATRRAGLRSFPWPPPPRSACPASGPTPPGAAARSPSAGDSASGAAPSPCRQTPSASGSRSARSRKSRGAHPPGSCPDRPAPQPGAASRRPLRVSDARCPSQVHRLLTVNGGPIQLGQLPARAPARRRTGVGQSAATTVIRCLRPGNLPERRFRTWGSPS